MQNYSDIGLLGMHWVSFLTIQVDRSPNMRRKRLNVATPSGHCLC